MSCSYPQFPLALLLQELVKMQMRLDRAQLVAEVKMLAASLDC